MNEYQVVFEKAKREANLKNETKRAYELLEEHEAVVLRHITRYCPYTDGILGIDTEIMGCGSLEEAIDWLAEHDIHPYDYEVSYQLLQRQEKTDYSPVEDDGIPF